MSVASAPTLERIAASSVNQRESITWVVAAHMGLLAIGIFAAALTRSPAALVLAAPSFVLLAIGLRDPRMGHATVDVFVDRMRALEGDTLTLTVRVSSPHPVPLVAVEYLPDMRLEVDDPLRQVFSVNGGSSHDAAFDVTVVDWGVATLGSIDILQRDRFGFVTLRHRLKLTTSIRVHVREENVRSLSEPARFRRFVGSHLSRERGDGCEIADVRPYQPGDRLQTLNWRISARRDEPWITLRHPDRSTSIVVLVDAFAPLGRDRSDQLRRSVRAALGLTRLHLDAQDPVGVLIVGEGMHWIEPALGPRHQHLISDALIDLSGTKWRTRSRNAAMADRLVPSDAIVVAVSNLSDARFVEVLHKLRSSGRPTQVIQPITDWRAVRPSAAGGPFAWRVHSLQQEGHRRRFRNASIPVHPWRDGDPVESALQAMRFRQRARKIEAGA